MNEVIECFSLINSSTCEFLILVDCEYSLEGRIKCGAGKYYCGLQVTSDKEVELIKIHEHFYESLALQIC